MTDCQLPQVGSGGGFDGFETKYMRCLYRQGYLLAFRGDPIWHFNPQDVRRFGSAVAPRLAVAGESTICRTEV
jgi:hypothetical protein